jgi:hypothetical protein
MARKNRDEVIEGVEVESTEVDAKKAAKKEARKAARSLVLKYLTETTMPEDVRSAIKSFVGSGKSGLKRSVSTINVALREALMNAGDTGLSEMDIFKMFKIGRPEMVTKIRILVLCKNPDDRVWTVFDDATETYKVVGLGKNPPEGWDGYIPTKGEDL